MTPGFSGVRVTRSFVLCICFVDRCLSFCTFSFGNCFVCSSSIYGFWLPLWYLQILVMSSRNSINIPDLYTNCHCTYYCFSLSRDNTLHCVTGPVVGQRAILQKTRPIMYNVRILISGLFVCFMVFNATFNNISVISWWSVLLVDETGVPRENNLSQVTDKFITKCCIEYISPWMGFELTTLVLIGTDCTCSCKSN